MKGIDRKADVSPMRMPPPRVAGTVSGCHSQISIRKEVADGMRAESESWRDELNLISDLAAVQKKISVYVFRALDADALRDEPTAPSDPIPRVVG